MVDKEDVEPRHAALLFDDAFHAIDVAVIALAYVTERAEHYPAELPIGSHEALKAIGAYLDWCVTGLALSANPIWDHYALNPPKRPEPDAQPPAKILRFPARTPPPPPVSRR
ncbi:hypothetical protein NLX83_13235 [Allokutzneria sp. A3M-2-11 16]|uniref:hypothetical protein n=1 Tax=Allokutzneria sp. A3M-2-11 16 TaxID=2962043 RepID=UPI0020B7DCF9|nr:hypothetical protein [Allokutzneria sp. A3M-2-11 16]MCP3800223.1 hypothetical protein [Allokutzneria sp. A3M-2-11 16]